MRYSNYFAWCPILLMFAGCQTPEKVGPIGKNASLVATQQYLQPAGKQIIIPGRPIDIAISPDGKTVYSKNNGSLSALSASFEGKTVQTTVPGGTSLFGIETLKDGAVMVSNAASSMHFFKAGDGGLVAAGKVDFTKPKFGGEAYPCGFDLNTDESTAYVALSRSNELAIVDLASKKVLAQYPVDLAPYDTYYDPQSDSVWVSCWGGAKPDEKARTQASAGTEVEVDVRGVAKQATLVQFDLKTATIKTRIPVGLQPSQLLCDTKRNRLYLANANDDTVQVIDTISAKLIETIDVKPSTDLLFGSAPNALELSADGMELYVANGGNNAIAVINVKSEAKLVGLIPTGWYPAAIKRLGDHLIVANAKGIGSRAKQESAKMSVYDFSGSLNSFKIPDSSELQNYTKVTLACNRHQHALRALERGDPNEPAVVVPKKPGQTSKLEHVVYILKENRTYDQVFGDLPMGDGDPKLCIFGRDISPNHHALAEQFVLLDNYYCNGVLSADGHSWAMEGNASSFLERSFGGWTRSYPYGDDPLNVSKSGFIWDQLLTAGFSFYNFGEFDDAQVSPPQSWSQLYQAHVAGKKDFGFKKRMPHQRMRAYSDPDYPGWNMGIPEVIRADIFLRRIAKMEKLPNFMIVYLPQDHGSGTSSGMPTPRAHMADNDLAMGRIVEALTAREEWKKMAIFINEDDPQDGFDHVDGHRSICLVVSPYTKRKSVISNFYNQTSVLHTINLIFGLPPLNNMVALSEPMWDVFTEKPDYTPYRCLPNKIPLDELNPAKETLTGLERYYAELSEKQNFKEVDAANEDDLNRIIWHSVKGVNARYPKEYAGAHGKGLAKKKLIINREAEDED